MGAIGRLFLVGGYNTVASVQIDKDWTSSSVWTVSAFFACIPEKSGNFYSSARAKERSFAFFIFERKILFKS